MSDDPLSWTVRSRETAYSCPGFDVIHEEVTLPDGTETDFDYLSEPPSVVVLPFTPDGAVVVIEEWRQAVNRVNRGLPAGTVEPDDPDLPTAARRELREETGYAADRLDSLGTVEPANGLADSRHHYFVAHGCTPDGDPRHDVDESIRVDTVDADEIWRAATDGAVEDGRTIVGLFLHHAG